MNEALNRRIANYLGRLVQYFDRPQIFDQNSMQTEAEKLRHDLDDDRTNEAGKTVDNFVWPPYEVPK